MEKKEFFPIHTYLFAMFPVAALYNRNIYELELGQLLNPVLVVLLITTIAILVLGKLLRSFTKASLIVSVFLILNFSFRYVYLFLNNFNSNLAPFLLITVVLGSFLATFVTASYYLAKSKTSLVEIEKLATIFSISLMMVALFQVSFQLQKNVEFLNTNITSNNSLFEEAKENASKNSVLPKRDIYYLIFDRYGSGEVLQKYYGFDNSDFEKYLEGEGFYVAKQSKSNYLKTAHSLSSSLNMDYIDDLKEMQGEGSHNWIPIYFTLKNYEVQRLLKMFGYKTIHFGSWWEPTSTNKYSDININKYQQSEFSRTLYKTTAIYPVGQIMGLTDDRRNQWDRVNYQLEKLENIPSDENLTFVFAHFLVPHPPYVFEANGDFVSYEAEQEKDSGEKYLDQVKFVNMIISRFVEKALTAEGQKPIIVIQGDEGPFPDRYLEDSYGFKWTDATKDELNKKMGILNAYYLPDIDESLLYNSITPVNTFRLIFSNYFNMDMEPLPDKMFIFTEHQYPYKLREVSDVFLD